MRKTLKFILLVFIFYCLLFIGFVIYIYNQQIPIFFKKDYVVIILTGDKNRIKAGISLAHRVNSKYVLISGVHTRTCLKDISKCQLKGVWTDDLDISVGYSAKNTVGNINESLCWCEKNNFKNIIIVTSDYHIPRVYLEFLSFKKDKDILFYAVKSEKFNEVFIYKCFREFNKCAQRLIAKFL